MAKADKKDKTVGAKKKGTVVGKALIYSEKRVDNATRGKEGDVIVVHPLTQKLSGYELAYFNMAEITDGCFSFDQLAALKEGRPLIHPFHAPGQRISAVKVKESAITDNLITPDDLVNKTKKAE